MRLSTSATRDAHPLLKEIALRWSIWRCKGTLWKIFNRWQLGCLFLLLIASTLRLSSQHNLWGTFLVLPVMSYLALCFEATWPEAAEAYAARLLARAWKAHQRGSLGRALRLARRAEALTRTAGTHAQAVELQGQILVQQGCGAAALRELSRTSSQDVPSAALRVHAHLLTGESSIALALAQRMFARAPTPDTARLISQALLQLQRPEEARHFANLAGGSETSHPTTPAPTPQAEPAPRPWEMPLPRGLWVSWMLATAAGILLSTVAVDLTYPLWRPEAVHGPYGYAITWAVGGLKGGLLGLVQAWVLRRVIPEPGRWPLLTALGYGLGSVVLRQMMAYSGFLGDRPPVDRSLVEVLLLLNLQGLLGMCFQALELGRWFRGSALWVLAMLGAGPLADLIAYGLVGAIWHPASLLARDTLPPTAWDWAGQSILRLLTQGLILGGVGGALLHRDWARRQEFYPRPPPRPLTADYPHVLARMRPAVIHEGNVPKELPLASMSGNLFCPGADAFFHLPEAELTRLCSVLAGGQFIIVPKQAGLTSGLGENPPQVGILARLHDVVQIRPGEDYRMTVRMLARVRIQGLVPSEHGPLARLEPIEDLPSRQPQAQLDRLRYRLNDHIRSTPDLELETALSLRDPVFLADLIASRLELPVEERRALLEELDPDSRISQVCAWLDRALLEPPRLHEAPLAHIMPIFFRRAWGE